MTVLQCIVTYVICWWMVLFMVIPHQAEAPKTPGVGHAPSAPANPQIGKKMKWTTLLAVIPAVALYFIVSEARAGDAMYHAGSNGGCKPHDTSHAPADLNARDGYGTNGEKVAPATLGGGNQVVNTDHIDIPLEMPTAKYLEPQAATASSAGASGSTASSTPAPAAAPVHNVDMSQSFAQMGKLSIGQDGSATLNGKAIVQPSGDCQ
jgi:predicted secreted protein